MAAKFLGQQITLIGKALLPRCGVQNKALPSFEQAGRFAVGMGCHNEQQWQKFTEGMTRADLFERLMSWTNQRVIQIALETNP
jgi:hypothetical protein